MSELTVQATHDYICRVDYRWISRKFVRLKLTKENAVYFLTLYAITLIMNFPRWLFDYLPRVLMCSMLCISYPSYSEANEQRHFQRLVIDLAFAQVNLLKATNTNSSGQ